MPLDMGQYYYIVNIDKQEYLNPHRIGDGAKAVEWLWSGDICRMLSVLLIDGDGRGGGDINCSESGRWAKDRIVVAGDYADHDQDTGRNIYDQLQDDDWTDITDLVASAIKTSRAGLENHPWTKNLNLPDWLQ